jgi:AraC-like DNA-binding protein
MLHYCSLSPRDRAPKIAHFATQVAVVGVDNDEYGCLFASVPITSVLQRIARRSGFGSGEHLSRVFARSVGMPPSEYRRQHRMSGHAVE